MRLSARPLRNSITAGWPGWFREVVQEAVRPERAADLLVVEDDPAQRFEALVVAARQEFSRTLGEISQDHAELAELLLCRE